MAEINPSPVFRRESRIHGPHSTGTNFPRPVRELGIISSHQFWKNFSQIFFSLTFAEGGPKAHTKHQPWQRGDAEHVARGDPFSFSPEYSWVTQGGSAPALSTVRITMVPSAPPSHLSLVHHQQKHQGQEKQEYLL